MYAGDRRSYHAPDRYRTGIRSHGILFDRADRDQIILNDPNDRYRDPGCGLWDRSLGLGRGDFDRA